MYNNNRSSSPLAKVKEAEAFLNVSRWTLRRMEESKELKAVRIRGVKRYRWEDLYELAEPKKTSSRSDDQRSPVSRDGNRR
jgi:hypothetical protein